MSTLSGGYAIAVGSVLALFIGFLALVSTKGRLAPASITVISQIPVLVGFARLDASQGTVISPWYGASILCFIGGYLYVETKNRFPPAARRAAAPAPALGAVLSFSAVVGGLAIYHIVAVGVPLTSNEIEIVRYNFSSSGLFGIPGRMHLFGMPFLVLYLTRYVNTYHQGRKSWLRAVWIVYACLKVASGFKGALAEVAILFFFARAIERKPLRFLRISSPKYAALGAAALVFAVFLAFRYQTTGVTDMGSAASYLADRVTIGGASAGHLALSSSPRYGMRELAIVGDLKYFINKYFDIHVGQEVSPPFDRTMSALLSRSNLSEDEFLPPVTVGGFPYFATDVGLAGGLILMSALGGLYATMFRAAKTPRLPFSAAAWGLAILMTHAFVLNGGLAYSFVNLVAVLGFMKIVERVFDWFGRIVRSSPIGTLACVASLRSRGRRQNGSRGTPEPVPQLWRADRQVRTKSGLWIPRVRE